MNDTNGPWHLHAVEDDDHMQAGDRGPDPLDPVLQPGTDPLERESSASMDDKDVRRLEDRIEAAEERGRLRLDTAMARTDGKLDTIASLLQEFGRQLHEFGQQMRAQASEFAQRMDAQSQDLRGRMDAQSQDLRGRLDAQSVEVGRKFDESTRRYDTLSAEMATRHRDLRNTVIATGLVVLFGVIGTLIGLKQVWIGGVQVGQSIQAPAVQQPVAPRLQQQAPAAQRAAPIPIQPHSPTGK